MADIIRIQEQPSLTISLGSATSTPDWNLIQNRPDFDSLYYPLSNPSGFATGIDSSNFPTTGQLASTGQFLVSLNSTTSGALRFSISGLESQTGNYYLKSNPSGFITGSVVRPNTNLLYDSSSSLSLDWNTQDLYSDGFHSLSWRSRSLSDLNGTQSADWSTRSLIGNWTVSETPTGNSDIVNLQALEDYAYPRSNPSGFATGIDGSSFVLKSESGAFYPASNPSGFITGLNSGIYVTGQVVRPSETGNFITSSQTGQFYPMSNPSGFATGVDASNLVSKNETGAYTGLFYPLLSNPSGYLTGQVVRPSDTGAFYPRANPSGFITGIDTSSFVLQSQTGSYTGLFYPLLQNPNGYVTGSVVRPNETGSFITNGQTGQFYPANNPSGYVAGGVVRPNETGAFLTSLPDDIVRTTGNQAITGDKHFYDAFGYLAIDIGSRYIMNSDGVAYINVDLGQLQTQYQSNSGASLSWLYGQCYDVSGQNSISWMTRQLEGTGGAGDIKVDWASNILSGVWSYNGAASAPYHLVNYNSLTGYGYPKSSNPSGYITGNVVRPTETGEFLTSSLTGSLTGAFYPLNNNLSGYVTGSVVRPSETGSFMTSGAPSGAGAVSIFALGNRLVISGATGAGGGITQSEADLRYYPLTTNPSGYTQTGAFTGVGTVTTYVSNGILTFSGIPNTGTGAYYPLSSNPSGYVTGQVVRPSDTGFFVTNESTIVRVDTNQAISGAKSFPGSIVDDSSVVSIEPSIRLLSTAGGDYSLDWDSRILYYAGGVPVLSWANTDMRDVADSDSLNWGTRQLFNSSGTNVLDWGSKTLTGGSWLCETPSVGGAVANYSSVTGYSYPLSSNPSGYVTGSVIRPTDTGAFITSSQTGLFYPRSANPSGYITGSVVRPSETGNFVTSSQTGQFYPASNPSGYSTGIDSSQFVTLGDAQTITGSKNFDSLLSATGASSEVKFGPYVGGSVSHPFRVTTDGYVQLGDLLGNTELSTEEGIWRYLEVDSVRYRTRELADASGTTSLLWSDKALVGRWTNSYNASASGDIVNYHSLTGFAYPLQSNPSGYATGSVVRPSETGSFVTTSQTGQFYPISNPSGFATGIDASSLVARSETGAYTGVFYPLNSNPSGYISNSSFVSSVTIYQTFYSL